MAVSARRVAVATAAAGISAFLFATSVFVEFEAIRIRLVREPMPVPVNMARIAVVDERAANLRTPFAAIARIRNEASDPGHFTIRIGARTVCTTAVAARSTRRIDCVVSAWNRDADREIVLENSSSTAWTIDYLELATHHGRSTGLFHALVVPSGASGFRRPWAGWSLLIWVMLTVLLVLPPPRIASIRLRVSHRIVSAVAMVPFAAALLAPILSPYRVVLSAWTFAGWLSIPLLPHLSSFAQSVGRALRSRVGHGDFAQGLSFVTERRLVCALSVVTVAAGIGCGARVVGASDEYGYVSQADLWLRGNLVVDQSFARDLPWPNAQWMFSPSGYRPHPSNDVAIVPAYSPGFPLMLAAVKVVGGHAAMFLVVPLCGGLFVLATYGLGLRLASGIAPIVATSLVATSPTVLAQTMAPMSDIPAAAAWTGALYLLFGTTGRHAVGAGLLSGIAVLIRPNLAPLALILASLYVIRARHSGRRALAHLAAFGAAAAPFAIVVAAINQHLYGSPLSSGYGALADLFDPARMATNLQNYVGWLVDAHTLVILIGLAAVLFPVRSLWPRARERGTFVILSAFLIALWAIYCAWAVFDSWWFIRFLLPSVPIIMLGLGVCADALFRTNESWIKPVAVCAVLTLAIAQLQFASSQGIFRMGDDMRRFAAAADLTKRVTPPNSVVLGVNHAGSIRYYGERMTMNINHIDAPFLDDVVTVLQQRGVRTYAALEGWERKELTKKFEGTALVTALDRPPVGRLDGEDDLMVFELSDTGARPGAPVVMSRQSVGWRAVPPGELPHLTLSRTAPRDVSVTGGSTGK